ncbi:MAG: glucosaminidase domain-containing protein [Desulfobacteraceae bacterium]|nr:glucosaminidase domain-containing protein [Desulfobacteraceae bacterium]
MRFGKKVFAVVIVCILFTAAAFLNSCGRGDAQSDIDPDKIIGKVELPPLNNNKKGAPREAGIKEKYERKGAEQKSRNPLPKNINTKLPDFTQYKDVETKKKKFFNFLRPIIRVENHKVLKERAYVLLKWQKYKNGEELVEKEKKRLVRLAEKYRVKSEYSKGGTFFRDLLIHIDKVPVDLALIQAAKESAWGTSYFAREGNNLFGQWCFEEGCGLVPRRRPEGATYEVKAFDDVSDSVRAYIHNLNSHPAYKDLRLERYRMRLAGREPDGHYMASGLEKYSEIGIEYVRTVRQMIRGNQRFMGIHDSTDSI